MGSELLPLLPKTTFEEDIEEKVWKLFKIFGLVCLIVLGVIGYVFIIKQGFKFDKEARKHDMDITMKSMDFTMLNVTETQLSYNWDVLIRIPPTVLGYYMCLKGNFQVFILYKGATIATSSAKSHSHLRPLWEQQFSVSMIASEGDMDGGTMKDITEVIKNKGEIQFGSRLIVPDFRRGTSGKMKYECDEATLHFGSRRDATLFGNYPICHYIH